MKAILSYKISTEDGQELPSNSLPGILDNEQVIRLIKESFSYQFIEAPSSNEGEVTLFVRKDNGTDWGFDFWFQVKYEAETKNFQGTVFGSEDLNISMGCQRRNEPSL